MLLHNYTRIYFDGEAANAADPVMALVPADRRATLIATRKTGSGNAVYRSTSACRATTRRCSSTCRRNLFGGLDLPIDLKGAGPDQRNQIAADRDGILRVFETAQQERMDAEAV